MRQWHNRYESQECCQIGAAAVRHQPNPGGGYRWTLRRFRPYQVRRSWAGYQFDLWISDPTAKSWYDRDSPEIPPEMSFLAQHRLRPGATVFDCGAHQCVIAMIHGQICRRDRQR